MIKFIETTTTNSLYRCVLFDARKWSFSFKKFQKVWLKFSPRKNNKKIKLLTTEFNLVNIYIYSTLLWEVFSILSSNPKISPKSKDCSYCLFLFRVNFHIFSTLIHLITVFFWMMKYWAKNFENSVRFNFAFGSNAGFLGATGVPHPHNMKLWVQFLF